GPALLLGGPQDHALGLVEWGGPGGVGGGRIGSAHIVLHRWVRRGDPPTVGAGPAHPGRPRRPRERRRPLGRCGAGRAAGGCGAKGPTCSPPAARPPRSRATAAIGASDSGSSTPISAW